MQRRGKQEAWHPVPHSAPPVIGLVPIVGVKWERGEEELDTGLPCTYRT